MMKRLLIPVDATPACRLALDQARALRDDGEDIEAVLLHVAEPVTAWQVLSFRTPEEVAAFQAERGQWLLEDAESELRAAGIPCESVFVRGERKSALRDAATSRRCDLTLPSAPPHPMRDRH